MSPSLTLNLGLRYEFATPQWEADNNLTNFDPATRTLIQATDGSIYDRALVNPDRNNIAPRLGLAYSLNDKTVLRSAYGMSYIHFNRLAARTCCRSTARTSCRLPSRSSRRRASARPISRRSPASGRRRWAIRPG